MGPFPESLKNNYILVIVDYVSRWVEAFALPTNDTKGVVKFLWKNIFTRVGTPRGIISDRVVGHEGSAALLVHGFGAFLEHYRDNICNIAKGGNRVWAITILGFGNA
ncbi:hypothetical protein L3X38_025289 [Prunus dulcis]|uniref:Integrase catalytic domain-containing protein n=1 Tax=Prunus dulcis TaxID=3755 RepID=A0AAD4W278_PRUDU|nr:hypothetical protein L3X38_025289 [Prunus dulcis]